ncbi:GNAT family N-acetyltransferase [Prosthecochloris sp. N3]|uniref:GNAT family N-acetyltransferase n=1 Tax=Prosthecochloris ethylica TaxID=2743976 RepID=A0ABR9XS77_9CHLB|nr:GNAT family N-acetyltransferase [Prosthecochloris ethylica]MBF0585376.1 GNAT family N-acetyltransferase [Prosthecochloris ethylica]MBF0636912.1 GNAT family N-acetyltransferase [Prosthecochloris ethylica]NUK46605.1 GNAT family N-acetyltransferase [Prosthecochloris ethylica]
MGIEIRKVSTKGERKRFIRFAWTIYRNDPELDRYWVPPVVSDYMKTLDTDHYPLYEHADLAMFTAWKDGRMAGTIAAVQNRRHNEVHDDKVGFWGFFECVNDQEVADALFDAAASWLRERGLDTMRGPVSPSMNDQCGMLVRGYDSPPVFLMLYNPPYYNTLATNYGHATGQELLAWYIDQDRIDIERLRRIAGFVQKREGLSIRTIRMKEFDREVAIIRDIYNRAWEKNWGFVPMTDREFSYLATSMKAIAKEHFIYFVEDSEGRPIGFSLTLPDMNVALKHVNGNPFTPWGLFRLWWYGRNISAYRTITMGVLPEYRNKGIDSMLNAHIADYGGRYGLYSSEMSWVLKSNQAMSKLAKVIGGIPYKEYVIYEKPI